MTSAIRAAFSVALHAKARTQFHASFFHHIGHLVAQQGLVGVRGVQARQLAHIAQNGVTLRHLYAIHVQNGYLAERHGLANLGKFVEGKAMVFKRNTANGQGQTDGFGTTAVKIEVREFELWHGVYTWGLKNAERA